jgi:hypothetical protein
VSSPIYWCFKLFPYIILSSLCPVCNESGSSVSMPSIVVSCDEPMPYGIVNPLIALALLCVWVEDKQLKLLKRLTESSTDTLVA